MKPNLGCYRWTELVTETSQLNRKRTAWDIVLETSNRVFSISCSLYINIEFTGSIWQRKANRTYYMSFNLWSYSLDHRTRPYHYFTRLRRSNCTFSSESLWATGFLLVSCLPDVLFSHLGQTPESLLKINFSSANMQFEASLHQFCIETPLSSTKLLYFLAPS